MLYASVWYGSSTIIPPSRGLDWESGTGVVRLVRRGSGLLSKLERLPVFRLAWWRTNKLKFRLNGE